MKSQPLPYLAWLYSLVTLTAGAPTNSKARAEELVVRQATSTAAAAWPFQTYVTESFTAPNLSITRVGQTSPGYLFFDPAGAGTTSQAPLIMTDNNELIWHGPSSDPDEQNNYQNFRVAELDGQQVLSYWYGYSLATFGHGYGSVAILDQNYHQLYNICVPNSILKINSGTNMTYLCNHDQHESLITSRGTIITSAYNATQADLTSVGGSTDGWVLAGLFFEIDIKTQEVLFSWNSLDHQADIPLTRSHVPGANVSVESASWDYFHINSIQDLPDGGYLVNSRHMFETYKVSANGTIEWRLNGATGGDFTLGPGVYFSWQHFPRLINTTTRNGFDVYTISYFNNDNSALQNGTNQTTGLYISLDLGTKQATLLQSLYVPSDPIYADSQGDTQVLPSGGSLMGYGQVPLIREYDGAGNLLCAAQFGPIRGSISSYRAYKYSWVGTPSTLPSVVAVANVTSSASSAGSNRGGKGHGPSHGSYPSSEGNVTVWVSWNGATEVDAWRILGGQNQNQLSVVGVTPKTGFETVYTVGASYEHGGPWQGQGGSWNSQITYVQVQALGSSGQVLSTSDVVTVSS